MSHITEQTIVIKREKCDEFEAIVANDYDVSNAHPIYEDDDFTVYVYDCNGDGVFYHGILPYIALEINYGGGDILTEITKEGKVVESDKPLSAFLQTIVPKEQFEKTKRFLEYTI